MLSEEEEIMSKETTKRKERNGEYPKMTSVFGHAGDRFGEEHVD